MKTEKVIGKDGKTYTKRSHEDGDYIGRIGRNGGKIHYVRISTWIHAQHPEAEHAEYYDTCSNNFTRTSAILGKDLTKVDCSKCIKTMEYLRQNGYL